MGDWHAVKPSELCSNADQLPALRKCQRCEHAFCDRCLVFPVNRELYCEVCGDALRDEVEPRTLLGVSVFGAAVVLACVANG